ncbi:MAG: peptidoglycan editing factor PgeF [Clostridiales bacterium]|jgi:YfiH family protein|nr:peptidoglycan editing factor PgeF [Clostridiales bacterium]
MRIKDQNGVPIAVFPSFEETGLVRHGISTRTGGVSQDEWASLNLSFHRGDDPACVRENFNRFIAALRVRPGDMVFSAQTHGVRLRRVSAADRGKGLNPSDIQDADGLYAHEPDVAIVTFFADCVPLFFLDPRQKVIAAAHAGWRGTAARIGAITAETLRAVYGCNPQDILAGIGPSIGPCCFQVDAPVAETFSALPGYEAFVKGPSADQKYTVDLWNCNKMTLLAAGLLEKNIDCDPICTCCHPELFYSHRRDGERRGSMAGLITL